MKPLLSKFYAIQESKIFATGSKWLKGNYFYKLIRRKHYNWCSDALLLAVFLLFYLLVLFVCVVPDFLCKGRKSELRVAERKALRFSPWVEGNLRIG